MDTSEKNGHITTKRRRVCGPKVRTGCLTCKTRRVKCDEMQPKCNRCTVGLRKCIWKEKVAPKPTPKALLPRQSATIIPQPLTILFTSDQEWRYFRIYSKETYQELSGAYQSTFWSQIVLQAAHEHSFIRSALIAIGSFAAQAKVSDVKPLDTDNPLTEERFALSHYQQFLRGSRIFLSKEDQTTRLALISCLIVICIENLQWHHATAVDSFWNGTKLLNNWLGTERRKGKRLTCISSPNPLTVEDGIVQQFKIYDSQNVWICDRRPLTSHQRLRYEGEETVQAMPESFKDAEEARLLLDLISRRIHHFIVSLRPGKLGLADFSHPGERGSFRVIVDREEPYDPITPEQRVAQESYFQEIKKWDLAFAALSQSTAVDSPHFVGVNLLRIFSRFLPVLLFGDLSTTEMIYDNFLQNFKDMVTFAKLHFATPAVRNMNPRGVYSLSTGITYPLHTLVCRCRDRKVRREAIDILVRNPWREGINISLSSGRIGQYLMKIEEKGVETYEIPENKRTIMYEMHYQELENMRMATVRSGTGVGAQKEVLIGKWEWAMDEVPWAEEKKAIMCDMQYQVLESRKTETESTSRVEGLESGGEMGTGTKCVVLLRRKE